MRTTGKKGKGKWIVIVVIAVFIIAAASNSGNDFDEIRAAFAEARATKGMPTAIIAKTLKGKGVSFMENAVDWHGKAPNDEEYKIAMEDLEKVGAALCQN